MMSAPFDVTSALKVLFVVLYIVLLAIGIATCFFGARAVRRWRRTIYFVSLFVLTNFVVLPLCWILFKFIAGMNDKIALGVLALFSTVFAWRISRLKDATIVRVYGALIGMLAGVIVGAVLGFFASDIWLQVSLWIAGAVLGWLLARQQPEWSMIVFFAASGAATATQSLLGLYEIATGKAISEVAVARLVQFFFPILYVVFSGFSLLGLVFWLTTIGLFIAGLHAQSAHRRAIQPQAAPSLDPLPGPQPDLLDKPRRLIERG